MPKTILGNFPLTFFTAVATLLLASGSSRAAAQQPPQAPVFRDSQMAQTGWLGISIEEVSAAKAQELKLPGVYGVLITGVGADGPAAKAGLKDGDVVTEYAGQRVEGVIEFRRLVRETPPGRTVKITLWRGGRAQTISAEVASNPNPSPDNLFQSMMRRFGNPGPNTFGFGATLPATPMLGITGQDLSGQLGKYFGAPDGEGVLITSVESNSPAAKAGIEAGDVITKVDGDRVRSLRELRDELRIKREAKTVTLNLLRKGNEMSMTVEPRRGRSQRPAPSIPL